MAISSITEWLNGDRLYSDGVKLFKLYGNDPFLLASLNTGYSTTVYKKLINSLVELERSQQKQDEPKVQEKYALPADLEDLQRQINDAYSRYRMLHADLDKQVNAFTRKEMVFEILNGFKWIDASYEIINHFKATGKRLDTTETPSDQPWTLRRIVDGIKLIPANITKTKQKLQTEKNPERIQILNERLANWENELDIIKDILIKHADVIIQPAK